MREILKQTVGRTDVRIELLEQEQAGSGGDASCEYGSVHQELYGRKETNHLLLFQLFRRLRESTVDIDVYKRQVWRHGKWFRKKPSGVRDDAGTYR